MPQTGTSAVRASTSSIIASAVSSVSAGPREMSHARCVCSRMSPSSIATPTWMCSAPSAHTMMRPRLAAEAQRAGRASARRRAELAVLEVAHLDRLIDALRDDAATEAGDAPDLGPGRRVAGAHHVDDAQKARHFVGLSAEAQCGLLGHGRFSHNAAHLPSHLRDIYSQVQINLGTLHAKVERRSDDAPRCRNHRSGAGRGRAAPADARAPARRLRRSCTSPTPAAAGPSRSRRASGARSSSGIDELLADARRRRSSSCAARPPSTPSRSSRASRPASARSSARSPSRRRVADAEAVIDACRDGGHRAPGRHQPPVRPGLGPGEAPPPRRRPRCARSR